MPEMVESATYLFADDTKYFREIQEENDEKMLQADLDSLQNWSDTWLLKFHPNKTPINVWTKEQNTIISMTTKATKLS